MNINHRVYLSYLKCFYGDFQNTKNNNKKIKNNNQQQKHTHTYTTKRNPNHNIIRILDFKKPNIY